jgi:outer membrane protein OmpA-like peptidoglycan-associated protein
MIRALILAALLGAAPALAQLRPFTCVGAERLEDDVFAVPFARGSATLGAAGNTPLDAAADLAKEAQERNICVLGHADRTAGAETSTQLAAQRARAVANALASRGVERDRIRAEARVGVYSGRVTEPGARAVTIVVMPAAP